jgi:3-oxoacyl-[acyl-carrier protein] reductase
LDLNLKRKVAIVTGAGRGIGRAIALTLANEGAFVVVNDIDLAVAKDVAENIVSMGSRSLAIEADITRADEVDKMVTRTLDEFKKVDILVNNAGIVYEVGGPITRKLFVESSPEEWYREVDLVFYGTLNCIKAVVGHMIKQKGGKIVNIASDVARNTMGLKRESIYSGAKGGVIAVTRSIALEVAEFGITVNTVSPGFTRTTRAMLAEKQREENPKAYEYHKFAEKSLAEAIPLKRMGEPDDVAKLVVFLASDAANWITGQTYSVNGGQVMI